MGCSEIFSRIPSASHEIAKYLGRVIDSKMSLREKRIGELREWVRTSMSDLIGKAVKQTGSADNLTLEDPSFPGALFLPPRTWESIERTGMREAEDRWMVSKGTAKNYTELALRPYLKDLHRGIVNNWKQKYGSKH